MIGDYCYVILDKEQYYPGQVINGRVACNFASNCRVRDIYVKFKGRAKVDLQQSHSEEFTAKETYFVQELNLLNGETLIPKGQHRYSFSFKLPYVLPPSVSHEYGDIKYTVEASTDRPWTLDAHAKKTFIVNSFTDLNTVEEAKKPIEVTQIKRPFSFFSDNGKIAINVKLPVTGYVPSQIVTFSVDLKNDSHVNVKEVRFMLVQGLTFHLNLMKKSIDTITSAVLEIIGSAVLPGIEKSWDLLELKIPANIFTGNLNHCNIIKSVFELRGEVVLPIPHANLQIRIPLMLGNVPLTNTSIS